MKSVLFVDDEIFALEYLKTKLTEVDFQCFYATSGQEALAIFEMHPDIDILVTDINMEGMDGFELLKIVRQQYPQTKRIVLSAHRGLSRIKNAIEEGDIDEFLPKPVEVVSYLIPILKSVFRNE